MNIDQVFEQFLSDEKGAGRGRKQCVQCKKYVGVRTHICECGHEFTKSITKKEQDTIDDSATDEERLYAMSIGANGGVFVYNATGSPSCKLSNDLTFQEVNDYCNLIVFEGLKERKIMTVSAIKKYIQHQFGYNTEEYKQSVAFVDQWYDEKIGVDTSSGDEYNEN
jgi:hypothetical protein